jgi:hypothetical protein
VLAAPWYVRSFIGTGDPIDPVLNLAIQGVDPKWSKRDILVATEDLKSHEGGPLERASIPWDIVLHTNDWQFRESGASFAMLGLLLPGAVVAYPLLRRRRPRDVSLYAAGAMVLFAIGYWVETSYLARYTLMFDAALIAFCAALLVLAGRKATWLRWVAIGTAIVFAIPSPGSAAFYGTLRQIDEDFYRNYHDLESWMVPRGPAYQEVEYVAEAFHQARREDLRVYRANIETDHLYWAQRGIVALGDVFGPERYSDFYRAINDDDVSAWVQKFHIGAFVLPAVEGSSYTPILQQRFDEEMAELKFHRIRFPNRAFVVYLAPGIPLPPPPHVP